MDALVKGCVQVQRAGYGTTVGRWVTSTPRAPEFRCDASRAHAAEGTVEGQLLSGAAPKRSRCSARKVVLCKRVAVTATACGAERTCRCARAAPANARTPDCGSGSTAGKAARHCGARCDRLRAFAVRTRRWAGMRASTQRRAPAVLAICIDPQHPALSKACAEPAQVAGRLGRPDSAHLAPPGMALPPGATATARPTGPSTRRRITFKLVNAHSVRKCFACTGYVGSGCSADCCNML
jgi:hypothetical protein